MVWEVGSETAMIKELLEKIKFKVDFKFALGYQKRIPIFDYSLYQSLLVKYNNIVKQAREYMHQYENETNIKFL